MTHRWLGAAGLVAVFCLLGSAEPPNSESARKAQNDYKLAIEKLHENYQKGLEPIKADYLKSLNEARKIALDKNDLEEAERIVAATKAVDEMVAPVQIIEMRHRLAGTVWDWRNDAKQRLTFNANGTVSLSWSPDAKGFWFVNPDATVVYWHTENPWAWVMKFNSDLTAYEVTVPKENLKWTGVALK